MGHIPEGCILLARMIMESEIWMDKPCWWLKVWIYLLLKVSHIDRGKYKRGQGFFKLETIKDECCLGIEGIKVKTIANCIKWLKSTTQITTQKTTRGMIITICNYPKYQDLLNYRNDIENDIENESKTIQKRYRNDTIYNNVIIKECKNIYNIWNSLGIIQHNPKTFKDFKPYIAKKLTIFTKEEIEEAMKNYKIIVFGDEYWFTHRWTLKEFLTRGNGFEKFLTINKPFENYRRNEKTSAEKEAEMLTKVLNEP